MDIDEKALKYITGKFALENLVIPLYRRGETLHIAAVVEDLSVLDAIRFRTGFHRIEVELVPEPDELRRAIAQHYYHEDNSRIDLDVETGLVEEQPEPSDAEVFDVATEFLKAVDGDDTDVEVVE